jgi:multidrug resistance efflux pump
VLGGAVWIAEGIKPKVAPLPTTRLTLHDNHPSAEAEMSAPKQVVVEGIGYAEPQSEIRYLSFKVDGIIAKCLVEEGQWVKQGEVVLTLRNQEQSASVLLAEKELALARAEYEKVLSGVNKFQIIAAERKADLSREQLRHARKEFERLQPLYIRAAIAATERDRAETDMQQKAQQLPYDEAMLAYMKNYVTNEDRRVAEAKVRVAEARLEQAQQQYKHTLLTAPIAGTALRILKREGDTVRLLDPDPVVLFADLSRLRVRAEIDERYISELQEGQTVFVSARGLGQRSFTGTIVAINNVMGKKRVFSRAATERKDLDVVEVLVDMEEGFRAPVGLQVEVRVVVN